MNKAEMNAEMEALTKKHKDDPEIKKVLEDFQEKANNLESNEMPRYVKDAIDGMQTISTFVESGSTGKDAVNDAIENYMSGIKILSGTLPRDLDEVMAAIAEEPAQKSSSKSAPTQSTKDEEPIGKFEKDVMAVLAEEAMQDVKQAEVIIEKALESRSLDDLRKENDAQMMKLNSNLSVNIQTTEEYKAFAGRTRVATSEGFKSLEDDFKIEDKKMLQNLATDIAQKYNQVLNSDLYTQMLKDNQTIIEKTNEIEKIKIIAGDNPIAALTEKIEKLNQNIEKAQQDIETQKGNLKQSKEKLSELQAKPQQTDDDKIRISARKTDIDNYEKRINRKTDEIQIDQASLKRYKDYLEIAKDENAVQNIREQAKNNTLSADIDALVTNQKKALKEFVSLVPNVKIELTELKEKETGRSTVKFEPSQEDKNIKISDISAKPSGVIYTNGLVTKDLINEISYNNTVVSEARSTPKVIYVFGDNQKDFAAAQKVKNGEEINVKKNPQKGERKGRGGQAKPLETLSHNEVNDVAMGVVTVMKGRRGGKHYKLNGKLKDKSFQKLLETTQKSIAEISNRISSEKPMPKLIIPVTYDESGNRKINIGTGIAMDKLTKDQQKQLAEVIDKGFKEIENYITKEKEKERNAAVAPKVEAEVAQSSATPSLPAPLKISADEGKNVSIDKALPPMPSMSGATEAPPAPPKVEVEAAPKVQVSENDVDDFVKRMGEINKNVAAKTMESTKDDLTNELNSYMLMKASEKQLERSSESLKQDTEALKKAEAEPKVQVSESDIDDFVKRMSGPTTAEKLGFKVPDEAPPAPPKVEVEAAPKAQEAPKHYPPEAIEAAKEFAVALHPEHKWKEGVSSTKADQALDALFADVAKKAPQPQKSSTYEATHPDKGEHTKKVIEEHTKIGGHRLGK